MKAVGIVRRIDELGRVVIPREIRRTMRISSGDEMEIFVSDEGSIALRKYSSVESRYQAVQDCCNALSDKYGITVLCSDRHNILAQSKQTNIPPEPITERLGRIMDERRNVLLGEGQTIALSEDDKRRFRTQGIISLQKNGVLYGSLILAGNNIGNEEMKAGELVRDIIVENIGD